MFVNILLSMSVSKLDKTFTYIVPKEMEQYICVGKRVCVPFGRSNREEIGTILEIVDNIDFDEKLAKKVIRVVDEESLISKFSILLAKWISRRYICNLYDSLRLFMPPGITRKNIETNLKTQKFVYLNENIDFDYGSLKGFTPKRKEILNMLFDLRCVSLADLGVYFNVNSKSLKWYEDNNLIEIRNDEIYRNPFKNIKIEKTEKLVLNGEQKNVYDNVIKSIEQKEKNEILLHGVTGSGKTEVYMHLIEYVLKQNKTAVMLVPEISLTPQIVSRFLSRFGNIVAILHSGLSIGERLDEYTRIKRGEAKIVIGARSAIFSPIDNIGIVIIDEEHDMSYKSEMTPKYDAIEVARKICEHSKCTLLLGSATPNISRYYASQNGDIKLLEMKNRINNNMPSIEMVDLLHEPYVDSSQCITTKMYNELKKNINNKEQSIIFLNKRGYCSSIICSECGYVFKCPNCDVTYTYHRENKRLMCHYCGKTEKLQNTCPECGSKVFNSNVIGTQKVEVELHKLFPEARILRMDKDTTMKKESYMQIVDTFRNEDVDILIGTQMVAKGHDFPNVTLVGVLNADMSLYMQEYNVNEITYSLITQVAGRAGRKDKKGRVLIQTYQKDNDVFKYIINNDYIGLYNTEINYRKILTYPPFCDIIQITLLSYQEQDALAESNKIYEKLKKQFKELANSGEIMIYAPMPALMTRINNEYRFKINIKCKYSEKVAQILKKVLNEYTDFNKVKISIDINSNNNI